MKRMIILVAYSINVRLELGRVCNYVGIWILMMKLFAKEN